MIEGRVFKTGKVKEWMDCGNKEITIDTNSKMLGFLYKEGNEQMISPTINLENSTIIDPCFIGENVVLKNATIGPNVSIGNNSTISNSSVKNSLIQSHTNIKNANLDEAMIGNYVTFDGAFTKVSIGDYSELE